MKKTTIIIGLIVILILIRHLYLYHLGDIKSFLIWMKNALGWEAIVIGAIFYVLMLSIPFFPGVEIAWLMIMIYGKEAIILIYLLTIFGLCISFGIGRWFEKSWLTAWLNIPLLKDQFRERTSLAKTKLSGMNPRLVLLTEAIGKLGKYHYCLLAVIINMPGNTLIGGGGGISFICGMNARFTWRGFITTIALAASPMPILLYFGYLQIENIIN